MASEQYQADFCVLPDSILLQIRSWRKYSDRETKIINCDSLRYNGDFISMLCYHLRNDGAGGADNGDDDSITNEKVLISLTMTTSVKEWIKCAFRGQTKGSLQKTSPYRA